MVFQFPPDRRFRHVRGRRPAHSRRGTGILPVASLLRGRRRTQPAGVAALGEGLLTSPEPPTSGLPIPTRSPVSPRAGSETRAQQAWDRHPACRVPTTRQASSPAGRRGSARRRSPDLAGTTDERSSNSHQIAGFATCGVGDPPQQAWDRHPACCVPTTRQASNPAGRRGSARRRSPDLAGTTDEWSPNSHQIAGFATCGVGDPRTAGAIPNRVGQSGSRRRAQPAGRCGFPQLGNHFSRGFFHRALPAIALILRKFWRL